MIIFLFGNDDLPELMFKETCVRRLFNKDGSPDEDFMSINRWQEDRMKLASRLMYNHSVEWAFGECLLAISKTKSLKCKN